MASPKAPKPVKSKTKATSLTSKVTSPTGKVTSPTGSRMRSSDGFKKNNVTHKNNKNSSSLRKPDMSEHSQQLTSSKTHVRQIQQKHMKFQMNIERDGIKTMEEELKGLSQISSWNDENVFSFTTTPTLKKKLR